jgi:hypothetical protein
VSFLIGFCLNLFSSTTPPLSKNPIMAILKYQHLRRLPSTIGIQRAQGHNVAVGRGILLGIGASVGFMSYHVITAKPTLPEGWSEASKAYRKFNKLDPIHR